MGICEEHMDRFKRGPTAAVRSDPPRYRVRGLALLWPALPALKPRRNILDISSFERMRLRVSNIAAGRGTIPTPLRLPRIRILATDLSPAAPENLSRPPVTPSAGAQGDCRCSCGLISFRLNYHRTWFLAGFGPGSSKMPTASGTRGRRSTRAAKAVDDRNAGNRPVTIVNAAKHFKYRAAPLD